jgi:hypothetical protein
MTKASRNVVAATDLPNYGPKMLALPSDKHREFVVALFVVRPGFGAPSRAARLAGWGTETSSKNSITSMASRLMHNEAVLDAIREYGEQFLRGAGPNALRALENLVNSPAHKDHGRAVAAVIDRLYPAEQVQTLNVRHDATPEFRSTAEVMARIAELSAKFGVAPPKVIDHEA